MHAPYKIRGFRLVFHTTGEDFLVYAPYKLRGFLGMFFTRCDDSLGNSILDCEDFAVHAPYKINRVSGFPIQLARIF